MADREAPPPPAPLAGPCFVAVGEDGFRAFSRDGRTWSNRATGKEGETLTAACFGGGRCVAAGRFGGINIFFSTADGSAWAASKHDAKYANYVRSVVWFRETFLAVGGENSGGGKPFALPSDDGVAWGEPRPVRGGREKSENALLRRFAVGAAGGAPLLAGVGDYGRKSVTADGTDWQNARDAKATDTLIDVAFGNGAFVGGGMHGLRMRSTDGLTWSDRAAGEEGEHINTMVWDGRRFVGIGQGATYTSPDGKAWERTPNENAPTAAAFGDGVYVGSLWQGRVLRSTDAVHWEQVAEFPQHVAAFAYGTLGKR